MSRILPAIASGDLQGPERPVPEGERGAFYCLWPLYAEERDLCLAFGVNAIAHDGETTWFEGLLLLALYAILGMAFFLVR